MSPKPSQAEEAAAQAALPPAVIAQAEAAIIGNFDGDDTPTHERRRSRTTEGENSRFPDFEEPAGQGGEGGAEASRSRPRHRQHPQHLQIPNILAADGTTEAPPAYSDIPNQLTLSQDGLDTQAKVTDDGRVNIHINQKTRKLSDLLVPALRNQLAIVAQEDEKLGPLPPGYIPPALGGLPGQTPPPKLNVVIHVVGSRGDVQPFVALGKVLKGTYGHRVRLATHPTFKSFVEENGLEFFSIGGDPSELMAFMVKNPGLMPGFDSLKSGDVGKRRKGMEEIVLGCWRSCIEAGDGMGAPPRTGSEEGEWAFDAGIHMDAGPAERPFIADAIIANPPSFAHVHIAEKMGIPLHMMFTMPWSPTQQFPHPLANIQSSNTDVNMTNFVSYALVEMMTWQGLGDVINRFRERALGLDPISLIWAPGMLSRLRVPYTYCWSPALIPKPKDWSRHISISGFYFLSLASRYVPDPELAAYLAAGPPPVYIGFGSIVVDDPDAMTKLIFEAVKQSGIRALVSKGWGGLGGDALDVPEGVFMLGNVPHDWLFQHVSCVVHHGGAGTTAAGIATGKPTVVVPFFGDQPFWGSMVARAGAGPEPIPYKQLTADKLATAITEALKPETLARAEQLGARIKEEKGCEQGGKSFHDMLDVDNLRCTLAPSRVAVWRVKRTQTRLSAFAANVLASEGLLDFKDLKLYRPREYETEDGPWDPISGGASALLGTIASLTMGIADLPIEVFKQARNKRDTIREDQKASSSSENSLSASASHSRSSLDSAMSEPLTPRSTMPDRSPSQQSLSTVISPKTSHEDDRFSVDTRTLDTPTTSTAPSLGEHRKSGSLRQALQGTLSRSRSGSRERPSHSRSSSTDRPLSRSGSRRREQEPFDPTKLTLEDVKRSGKGAQRIVAAGMKSPMDFTLGLARGFHNAPKLYGDDTVRPQARVTDLQSGLKAAGKEFGFGFYDGITGLITQPIRGAEKEGAAGLIKGIGKGIGGLILKPGAAIWGLPGYTFMGIHKEVRKMFGSSVANYIIAARTAQGFEEAKTATTAERQDIVNRWRQHKTEYQNERQNIIDQGGPDGQDRGCLTPKGIMQTRHLSFDERKKLHEERKAKRELERHKVQSEGGHRNCPFCRRDTPHTHTPRAVQETPIVRLDSAEEQNLEFEHAIHASVAATSRGNVEEDAMIERAIRASVRELQSSPNANLSDPNALNRAIQASIAEASRRRSGDHGHSGQDDLGATDEDTEYEAQLKKAIQQSLMESETPRGRSRATDGQVPDSDDDEDIRLAIQKSKEPQTPQESAHDDALQLALQKSKEDLLKTKTEEDIVLEYVKKQSLAEEAHKQAVIKQQRVEGDRASGSTLGHADADEQALKDAIAASLRTSGAGAPSAS